MVRIGSVVQECVDRGCNELDIISNISRRHVEVTSTRVIVNEIRYGN